MLKRLQSARMFAFGDNASITKLRRASKTEVDVHGMHSRPIVASIDAVMELTHPPRAADRRAGARQGVFAVRSVFASLPNVDNRAALGLRPAPVGCATP